jgi:hypothetical protein
MMNRSCRTTAVILRYSRAKKRQLERPSILAIYMVNRLFTLFKIVANLPELRDDVSNEITFLPSRDQRKLQISSIIFSWLRFLSLPTKAFTLISQATFRNPIGDLLQNGKNLPQPIETN